MFISKSEKDAIFSEINRLKGSYDYMRQCLDRLMLPAPYGRCKDGSPRLKPGRKTIRRGENK